MATWKPSFFRWWLVWSWCLLCAAQPSGMAQALIAAGPPSPQRDDLMSQLPMDSTSTRRAVVRSIAASMLGATMVSAVPQSSGASSSALYAPSDDDGTATSDSGLTRSSTKISASAKTTTNTPPLDLALDSTATPDWSTVWTKASRRAVSGGRAGASAAVVQVGALMWLRTSMNYQYRYGGTLPSSLRTLWQQGGLLRLYQGLPWALLQGPATRFGDTAANVGVLAILQTLPATAGWPLALQTAGGSLAAGAWRIILMPLDATKTAGQVEGADGVRTLWARAVEQPSVLYQGALAQAAATAVGHFPWFVTYNALDGSIPLVSEGDATNLLVWTLGRSALLGCVASCVSDCCSNSLRVIKTTKQTAQLGMPIKDDSNETKTTTPPAELSYPQVVQLIVEQDGVKGLFGRGLQTRLLTNAIQGAVFSVLWKYFQQTNGM